MKKNKSIKIMSGNDEVFMAGEPLPFFVLNFDILLTSYTFGFSFRDTNGYGLIDGFNAIFIGQL